jgi:hypothetical protein
MTLITYAGRADTIAESDRFYLASDIDRLPDGHPLKTFVYGTVSITGLALPPLVVPHAA